MALSQVEAMRCVADLDDYMESDEAKNHEQGDEYIIKFRKVSGNNKDGESHIK